MNKIDVTNRDIILTLRGIKPLPRGLTFEEIGEFRGVSRQRIHQIASNPNYRGQSGRPRKEEKLITVGKSKYTEDELADLRYNAGDNIIGSVRDF